MSAQRVGYGGYPMKAIDRPVIAASGIGGLTLAVALALATS
jgi:hypothetical protein